VSNLASVFCIPVFFPQQCIFDPMQLTVRCKLFYGNYSKTPCRFTSRL